jgi:hypothetical protein
VDKEGSAVKPRRYTRAGRRRAEIDAVLAAYSAWKRECSAVGAAYGRWKRAARSDALAAFAAYRVALEREERAADTYARLLPRAQRRPEFDVVRQLAQLSASYGAS